MIKKNTKKYDYIVNISEANCANDVYLATAIAKIDTVLTPNEIIAFIGAVENNVKNNIRVTFIDATKNCDITCNHESNKTKKSLFRRILDWIKRK